MATNRGGQFDYPEKSWSEGRMRMSKAGPRGDPGKEFRELEGIRKKKEQILSQGEGKQYAQMNRNIVSDADVGTGAGAMSQDKTINFMDKFLQGQKIAQGQFDTVLSPREEVEFAKWKKKHAPNDSGQDYDLRGAFKSGFKPDENGHLPDLYKKPNHPTFSDQSIYAKEAPDKAGKWEGETYIPPGGG